MVRAKEAGSPGRRRPVRKETAGDTRIAAARTPEVTHEEVRGEYEEGQSVELVILNPTTLGYNATINDRDEGLLYKNEVFQPLRKGQRIAGFIKKVRDDGKIDLCLRKPGVEDVDEVSSRILDALKKQGGFIAVNDKTPPETIYQMFRVSKKTYKKAIGALFRRRLIVIESDRISLVKDAD